MTENQENHYLTSSGSALSVNDGQKAPYMLPPKRASEGRAANSVVYTPVDNVGDVPFQLYAEGDINGFKKINELVKNAGFSSFDQALEAASMDPLKGERTWKEYLQARAANPDVQAWVAANSRGGSGGVSNSTTTSVNESSRSQAGSILDQNYKDQLGRTASKKEIIDFQQALNEQQQNNPTVTNSRSVSGGGSTTSSTNTKGGFDYTRFARQYAQKQPEFEDRYAAVTFMSILDSAISDPNAIDQLVAGA